MLVTLLGIITLLRDLQSLNAYSPMLVTLLGIVTLVRDEQPSNALSSILVTLSGIVTLVRDLQPENALMAKPLTPVKFKSPESVVSHPTTQPSTNFTPGIVF